MDSKISDPTILEWAATAPASELTAALRIGMFALANTPHTRAAPRSAAETGKNGEKQVAAALREHFGALIDTSATPHSGDIAIFHCGNKIIIEVKNYAATVPAAETAKFVRDLDTSASHGGVFVSLATPIAGVNGKMCAKYESTARGSIPCIYICSDDPDMIVGAVQMCAKMAALARESAEISADFGQVIAANGALAAARAEISAAMAEISRRLLAASTGIARCESAVGAIVASHGVSADPFTGDPKFAKHTPALQRDIRAVARLLAPESLWKVSRNKMSTAAGTITLYAGSACVAIPRVDELIPAAVAALGADFGLDATNFILNITPATAEWIEKNYVLVSAEHS